jgi:hypothetical protein
MNVWSFIVLLIINFGTCIACIFQQNIHACAYYGGDIEKAPRNLHIDIFQNIPCIWSTILEIRNCNEMWITAVTTAKIILPIRVKSTAVTPLHDLLIFC